MPPRSVAEQAQRALEVHLLDGSWLPGTRLRAERALAESLGVSRNSLREAIFWLKARGMLISKRGSGLESHTRTVADQLRQQHLGIWEAIGNRQADAARQAMIAHIDFTWSELARREHGKPDR